jgi:hypothetical protein
MFVFSLMSHSIGQSQYVMQEFHHSKHKLKFKVRSVGDNDTPQ